MISISDMNDLLAGGFFDGNTTISGLVMFSMVMILLFAIVRKPVTVIILAMPVTLIFASLGILSTDMMVLLIIVAALTLATIARDTWRS